MKNQMGLAVIAALIVLAVTLSGCGGGDAIAPVTPPVTHVDPPVHSGYVAMLSDEENLLAQDSPDHWSGHAGIYKAFATRADQIGTMSIAAVRGGVDYGDTTCAGKDGVLIKPLNRGWILGPGDYKWTIPIPGDDAIVAYLHIASVEFNGLTVRKVAMDDLGNPFPKSNGVYLIPVGKPFRLVNMWSDGKIEITTPPTSYYVNANWIDYDIINWLSNTGGMMEGRYSGDAWATINVSPSGSDMGPSTVVDVLFIRFTPEITIGPRPGNG